MLRTCAYTGVLAAFMGIAAAGCTVEPNWETGAGHAADPQAPVAGVEERPSPLAAESHLAFRLDEHPDHEHHDHGHAHNGHKHDHDCVVSGEPLGEFGDPYVVEHEGRFVLTCCRGCSRDFADDPQKYLNRLDGIFDDDHDHDGHDHDHDGHGHDHDDEDHDGHAH